MEKKNNLKKSFGKNLKNLKGKKINLKSKNYNIDLSKEYIPPKYMELYIDKKLSLREKIARHLAYKKWCKLCKKLLKNETKQSRLFKEMYALQKEVDKAYDRLGNY